MRKRLLAAPGIAFAAAAAMMASGGTAWAATQPTVTAAVTGFVSTVANTACAAGQEQANFSQVAITGTFTDSVPKAYVGTVGLPSGITACVNVVVGAPNPQGGDAIPAVATGTLQGAAFGGTGLTGTTLNGNVTTGSFIQAGTVAEALVGLSYSISGGPTATLNARATIGVSVQPNVGQCAAGAQICEGADGPVVGPSPA